MLLEEDPSTLIRHTISNFNISPDRTCIARISESLSTLHQARDLRLRGADDALRRLSRQLSTAHARYDELASAHSSTAHASEIARLDTQKFRTAKAVSDLEMETERLQAQREELEGRLQELEMQGVDGGAAAAGGGGAVEDEVVLRLRVYRSLGIELEKEGGGGGGGSAAEKGGGDFTKAVVRNDRKGDVHVVNMDKKFSRFFYANYFWNSL